MRPSRPATLPTIAHAPRRRPKRQRGPSRPAALSPLVILALSAVLTPGCYKRVVGAKGIGTEGMTVYEPSVGEGSRQGALDGVGNIIFGPVQTEKK